MLTHKEHLFKNGNHWDRKMYSKFEAADTSTMTIDELLDMFAEACRWADEVDCHVALNFKAQEIKPVIRNAIIRLTEKNG